MTDDPRDPSAAKFLRGLTIGALIGAVIAGSSIWSRRFAARDQRVLPVDAAPGPKAAPVPAPAVEPAPTTAPLTGPSNPPTA